MEGGRAPTPTLPTGVLLDLWSLLDLRMDPSSRACRAGLGKGPQASRFRGLGLRSPFQPSPCSLLLAEPKVLGTPAHVSHLFPVSRRSFSQTNSELKAEQKGRISQPNHPFTSSRWKEQLLLEIDWRLCVFTGVCPVCVCLPVCTHRSPGSQRLGLGGSCRPVPSWVS